MRDFWDAKARENALYFVNNELDFSDPDEARFWASGLEVLETLLGLFDLSIRPTDRVVEIGCGVGRITRPLAQRANQVTGVDVSPEMLRQCESALGDLRNVELIRGNGYD